MIDLYVEGIIVVFLMMGRVGKMSAMSEYSPTIAAQSAVQTLVIVHTSKAYTSDIPVITPLLEVTVTPIVSSASSIIK